MSTPSINLILQATLRKHRTIALWIATGVLALVIGLSGLSKLVTSGEWDRLFVFWGYPAWFSLVIGGLEVGGAAALFVRKIAWIGASLLAVIMLGAFATLITHPGSHNFRGRQAPISSTEPLVWFVLLIIVGTARWRQMRPSVEANGQVAA